MFTRTPSLRSGSYTAPGAENASLSGMGLLGVRRAQWSGSSLASSSSSRRDRESLCVDRVQRRLESFQLVYDPQPAARPRTGGHIAFRSAAAFLGQLELLALEHRSQVVCLDAGEGVSSELMVIDQTCECRPTGPSRAPTSPTQCGLPARIHSTTTLQQPGDGPALELGDVMREEIPRQPVSKAALHDLAKLLLDSVDARFAEIGRDPLANPVEQRALACPVGQWDDAVRVSPLGHWLACLDLLWPAVPEQLQDHDGK